MAPLTKDRKSIRKDGVLFYQPVEAGKIIYAGSLVNQNRSGYCIPAGDEAGDTFTGKADMQADNSHGHAGDISVEGHRQGVFSFHAEGMNQSHVNQNAYVIDDNTVGLGIAAQPVNITGVTAERLPTTRGGEYVLSVFGPTDYPSAYISFGDGGGVRTSPNRTTVLTSGDGSQILVTIDVAALPSSQSDDTLLLHHVKCGKIVEVVSATSVFVDIGAA